MSFQSLSPALLVRETYRSLYHTTTAQTGAPQRGNPNPPPHTQGVGQVQVEYRNAVCGESRTYGVDAGKERKLLPMHTKPGKNGVILWLLIWLNGLWSPLGIVRLLTAESVAHGEPCLSSDMRIEWPASNSGTVGGGKPTDKEPDLLAKSGKGANPAPYADERNLCLKRRHREVAKPAVTPRPKWQGGSLDD